MTLKSTAPFSETSPMLYNISGAANWNKVANVRKWILDLAFEEKYFKNKQKLIDL